MEMREIMGKSSGYKNITRIDQHEKKMHGWYVRINFKDKNHPKFFNDKFHDGKDAALKAAVAWRDDKCREIGRPITERRVVSRHPKNKTGVIGIRRYNKKTGTNKDGKPYYSDVYEVTWCPEPNTVKRIDFSVAMWGEKGAFEKALELRRQHERLVYGREFDSAEK